MAFNRNSKSVVTLSSPPSIASRSLLLQPAVAAYRTFTVRHQKGGPRSEFTGYVPDKRIEYVCIEGQYYDNKRITDATGMGMRKNKHVADICYK
jgi:hypothetical protein